MSARNPEHDPSRCCLLNGDSSIIFKGLEVRLKSQVIVHWLDVGRKDFAALDICRARGLVTSRAAHSSVGAVAFGGLGERRAG